MVINRSSCAFTCWAALCSSTRASSWSARLFASPNCCERESKRNTSYQGKHSRQTSLFRHNRFSPFCMKMQRDIEYIFWDMPSDNLDVKGSVEWSRHERQFFAYCSLIFYFLDFKFSNFFCPSKLHPLIWFFLKKSFRKKKKIQKTTQNALAPSIFIVLSIVLKLGTPLLHIQAQNTLLQNF